MQRRQGANANGARASVKSQRRVNTQLPVRNVSKKKPQKENQPKQPVAPVGVSGVPLSARFSSLQKQALVEQHAPASKKNVVVNAKKPLKKAVVVKKNAKQQLKAQEQQKQKQKMQKQKMQKVAQASKTKRQEAVNKRRKGLDVAPAVNEAKKNKANGAAVVPKSKKNGPNAKDVKKPLTGEDLDVEMDSYWHEAGKGPDPQQALLDRQMEEYWAGKPKRDGEAAPETTTA